MGAKHSFLPINNTPYSSGLAWPWPTNATADCDSTTTTTEDSGIHHYTGTAPLAAIISLPTDFSIAHKRSVADIVNQLEQRHRQSQEVPRPISRNSTTPSPLLRRRFDTALDSKKTGLSGYTNRSVSSGRIVQLDGRAQIKTRPEGSESDVSPCPYPTVIKIHPQEPAPISILHPVQSHRKYIHRSTSSSASPPLRDVTLVLKVPEESHLPVVATISSSMSIDRPMHREPAPSGSDTVAGFTSANSIKQRSSKAATMSGPQEEVAGAHQRTLSLRSVRRGVTNVSENSLPAPQVSEVVVQGEFFVPEHGERLTHENCISPAPVEDNHRDDPGPTEAVQRPGEADQTSPTVEQKRTDAGIRPLPLIPIPDIQVHAPPDASRDTGATMGTDMMSNQESVPVSPTTIIANVQQPPASAKPALDPSIGAAPPLDFLGRPPALPGSPHVNISKVQFPTLPGASRDVATKARKRERIIGKAKRAVGRTRRLVLRKRVLSVLLGKDVAETVHPLLNVTTKAEGNRGPVDLSGPLPLPTPGPRPF